MRTVALTAGLTAFAFSTAAAGSVSIKLARPLPSVVRQQGLVTVTGATRHAPRHAQAVLEAARGHGAWTTMASAGITSTGAFVVRWRVPKSDAVGPVSLRIVVIRRAALLAATAAQHSAIGPPYVPCKPPVPPAVNIPVGDGWIVGGAYGIGGAFPGIDQCLQQQYTVTATDANGNVQATQTVAADHSYTLAPLPAGKYTLRAGACTGTATVVAGKQTVADADCLYP